MYFDILWFIIYNSWTFHIYTKGNQFFCFWMPREAYTWKTLKKGIKLFCACSWKGRNHVASHKQYHSKEEFPRQCCMCSRSNVNERAAVFSAEEDQKQHTGKRKTEGKTRDKFFFIWGHGKTLVSIHLYTLLINSENYLFSLSHYLSPFYRSTV